MTIKHSPKKFNSVYGSVKTNNNLWFQTKSSATGTGGPAVGKQVSEGDYLTIGVMPSLNSLDQQVTKFSLQMRIEQSVILTEPLEDATGGSGNFPLPRAGPSDSYRTAYRYMSGVANIVAARNYPQASAAYRRFMA